MLLEATTKVSSKEDCGYYISPKIAAAIWSKKVINSFFYVYLKTQQQKLTHFTAIQLATIKAQFDT